MASKKEKQMEKQKNSMIKKNNKLSDFINASLDKLYSSTYYSNISDKQDLDTIKTKLDNSIDNLVTVNKTNSGKASLSTLYSRLAHDQDNKEQNISKSLEELLNDNAIMDASMMSFINNTSTSIFDYDNKIDTIIKYMPKLKEALDCRKDNVLSADHFSKDFINVINRNLSEDTEFYNEHIKEIKNRYHFQDLADELYDYAATYGEAFLYIVPAKKAITRLLKNKQKAISKGSLSIKESCIINESGENYKFDKSEFVEYGISADDIKNSNIPSIQIECNKSGMITSLVEAEEKYNKSVGYLNEMSLYNDIDSDCSTLIEQVSVMLESRKSKKEERGNDILKKNKMDKTIKDDDLTIDNFDYSQEGLIGNKSQKHHKQDKTIDIPGSIIKRLDRKNVVPIYIEDHCFGYYYIETEGSFAHPDMNKMQDPVMSLKGTRTIANGNSDLDQTQKQNNVLRYLSRQISQFIDSTFVNANQDLRDEIYMILKHNDQENINRLNKIKITFIPPDDIVHIYFQKNPETHRGISDLHKALFPATLYSSMYITNCLWTMTRSQDKRVYYVKQSVDTNISKTLLETINQIKKGNMNIRQIENINHIMNITGKFNDYVIPKSASGDVPIEFEIMPGQQIEFKTELMTVLEEMAVNSTDVPMEMIQMRQSVDYATQLSMSSSKFLRKVYNRQSKYQKDLTLIFNKLYNNEYDDEISLEVKLPPPMFLNITNTNQMINNVQDYSNSVAEIMLDGTEDDTVKQAVIREINKRNLGSYLDIEDLEETVIRAKQDAAAKKNDNEEE